MKKHDKMYKVLEPLVNQILFGVANKPLFNLSKCSLSNEFTRVCNQIKDDKESETFLNRNIISVFKDFDKNKRFLISKIILNDSIYVEMLTLLDSARLKTKISDLHLIKSQMEYEIINFTITGDVNSMIILYFILYFEEIFYYNFDFDNAITEDEYIDLYSRFTNTKSIVK